MIDFAESIRGFNRLYKLPVPPSPELPKTRAETVDRLRKFKAILIEEINEVDDIILQIEDGSPTPLATLTDIADWLGDIQVYCASEMTKYGLENDMILDIIMASNMSKLGADGQPIYDERGKVCKGPNFFPPESLIRQYIQAFARQFLRAQDAGNQDSLAL